MFFPIGKCAYFNTYGSGNVDERECKPQIILTCSEIGIQFESKTNTQCKYNEQMLYMCLQTLKKLEQKGFLSS